MNNEYGRNASRPNLNHSPSPAANSPAQETGLSVDGFGQVLELLKAADPAFRESLLKRLASRDAQLAKELRADLFKRTP